MPHRNTAPVGTHMSLSAWASTSGNVLLHWGNGDQAHIADALGMHAHFSHPDGEFGLAWIRASKSALGAA